MTQALKIVVAGASGRMGQMLIKTIIANENTVLHAAIDHPQSTFIGQDAGKQLGLSTQVNIQADIDQALQDADVLIDFTRPQGSLIHINACIKHQVNLILGTTGFSDEEKLTIHKASGKIAIVFAANFSIGVNATFALLSLAAKILHPDYDIEIIEAHHRHKVDAPSGTALRMGEVIAETLNTQLNQCAIYAREGHTGERQANTIGFSTIRGGDIVGDHTVMFATEGERVEITHKASSRMTFASGAIRAALWLQEKNTGLYDMQDVLQLKSI